MWGIAALESRLYSPKTLHNVRDGGEQWPIQMNVKMAGGRPVGRNAAAVIVCAVLQLSCSLATEGGLFGPLFPEGFTF